MDILVDDIFDYIGHFGFYHWILYALLCVLAIAQGYQVVSGVFVTYEQDFRCSIAALANLTLQQQERVAIPKNTEGAYDHCHVFTWDWNSHSPVGLGTDDLTNVTSHWNHTTVTSSMNLTIIPQEVPAIACNNFIFDETVFGASLQSQVHKFICRYLLFKKIIFMMTSTNGNIFRVTGPSGGELTGHRWIPLTKASDAELWYFLWTVPE